MEAVGEYGDLDLERTRPLSEVLDGYTYFRDGDVVVAKITPCFENGKGALAADLSNGIAFGTTELHVLRALDELDGRYLFYLTVSHRLRRLGESTMYGAGGQKRVSADFIREYRFEPPPLPTQRAIAAFLDCETASINALIEKKHSLLDLLDEKRTALIARGVTRGLDPDVPMKDSGVEWLGEIPAHWKLGKMKQLVPNVTVGIVVTPAKYYVEEGVPCLRSLNISGGAIDLTDLVFISEEANALHSKSMIYEGDVVVVRTGRAGAAAIIPATLDGCNCIDLLIIRRSEFLVSEFVYYYLNSEPAKFQAEAQSVGAIQAHYNTSTLGELVVPVPPKAEQVAIADFLFREANAVDRLIQSSHHAISLLGEFRTALISAAVSGQIDVETTAA